MCGWVDRMLTIELGECLCVCVWTDLGLCYYSRALASGSRLCGAQRECLHRIELGLRGGAHTCQ